MTPDNDRWREVYVASARERRWWLVEGAAYFALGLFCLGVTLASFGAYATMPSAPSLLSLSMLCALVVAALVVLLFGVALRKGLALMLDGLVTPRVLAGPISNRVERRNPRGPTTREVSVGDATLFLSAEGYAGVQNCPRARVEHGRFGRYVRRVWLPT